MRVPPLNTERLLIRELEIDDSRAVHQLLDVDLADTSIGQPEGSIAERRRWLEWTILGYEQLPRLHQPPYGERAMVLRDDGELVGACGFAPCLGPFDQIPALRGGAGQAQPRDCLYRPEVGLYWAVSPAHQRHGYATEAARALVGYALRVLQLRRIIATTDYSNAASIGVMRKLGMRIERNPSPEPPWLQIVGVLEA